MAVIRATDHPNLVFIPLAEVFQMHLKEIRPKYSQYINVENIDMQFDESLKIGEFSNVPLKQEGALFQFENIPSSSTKRITPQEYGLGYVITRKMRDDDRHGVMIQMTQQLRVTFRHLFEVTSAKLWNNATNTAAEFLGLDGQPLLSTVHPLMGGGTQANRASTDLDLSSVAVEAAVINFSQRVGESNQPRLVTPEFAVVPTSSQFEAARIFRNAMQAGTADNDNNWVRVGPDDNGISKYVVLQYLADQDAWFISAGKASNTAVLKVRVNPEFQVGSDFRTDNYLARGYARLESGFYNYHHFYGSLGAA